MTVEHWDREADIVVIGSGATGMPAAIVAREAGASVIVVEAQNHIGGHAITSGRQPAARRRHQLPEEIRHRGFARPVLPGPDRLVGGRDQRLSALPLQRPRDHSRVSPTTASRRSNSCWRMASRSSTGRRTMSRTRDRRFGAAHACTCAVEDWPMVQTGKPADPARATTSSGTGLMRPLHAAALKAGVDILLEHRMTAIHREAPHSGRVTGIAVDHNGVERSTSAPARPSSSPPAARPETSISAACSTRG